MLGTLAKRTLTRGCDRVKAIEENSPDYIVKYSFANGAAEKKVA